MVRRSLWATLGIVVLFATIANGDSLVSRANTNQKGSLLIFPKIQTVGDPESNSVAVDTIIYLSNDNSVGVNLKCYWVDENQTTTDFTVHLREYQPLAFSARSGSAMSGSQSFPAFAGKGQLLCWAVDAHNYAQIEFNHLYGTALIQYSAPPGFDPSPVPSAISYNAWAFRALQDPGPANGGTPGLLPLDGVTYDACPSYLVASYTPGEKLSETLPVQGELTLSSCRQDLRQDRIPTCTRAKFEVWNGKGDKYTGGYQCLIDWYEGFLEKIGKDPSQKGRGAGGYRFTFEGLGSYEGRFRVLSSASTLCNSTVGCPADSQVASPFVGVLSYQLQFPEDNPDRVPFAGFALQGAGADTTGFLRWDPPDPQMPPVAVITHPWTGMVGVPVTFDGRASTDPNACHGALPCLDEQLDYEWDLNGDGVFNGPEDGTPVVAGNYSRVTKTFDGAAIPKVSLKVTDSYGMVNETTAYFIILPVTIVIDKDYEVCSETPVNKFVTRQLIRVLFKNTQSTGAAQEVSAYLTSVPSNFTKIFNGNVAVGSLEPGAEVWSTCDVKSGIELKLDKRVKEPVGEWRWSLTFKYDGKIYEVGDVPMQ